jgi:hypothetical protein
VSDLFLGVIAAAVVIMAAIQVAAILFAIRSARRVGDAVSRLEERVSPIVADLQSISSQAARASSLAAAQVERADQLITDLSRRVEDTAAALQSSIITPAREGFAVVQGVLAAFSAFSQRRPAPRSRPAPADEEDPLFIG